MTLGMKVEDDAAVGDKETIVDEKLPVAENVTDMDLEPGAPCALLVS